MGATTVSDGASARSLRVRIAENKFATTQHYGHPEINPATFRLKLSGMVDRPK